MKKIGFVTPWYGETIGGGAEAELRGVVHHLQDAGVDLEVLTTCAESFNSDWNVNYHPPGLTEEKGIRVRRFPVRPRDTAAFDAVNLKLIRGQSVTPEEEETFCREMINSTALCDYLRDHGGQYGLFVFIPYMFGTTYYGCRICPEKSVLIPCFHDESYARMACFRDAFSRVVGMVFNAEPERLLAEELFGVRGDRFVTFGIGMDTGWQAEPDRFRRKYGISGPFILYAGRKEAGKKVDLLISHFRRFLRRNPCDLKLVLIGGGKIDIPDPENILDLGFVDVQDKYDAYRAAEIFCNPSEMESFSLVMMESWLAETPVLVNGKCAVTRDFACRAGGGLYFENYPEFEQCVRMLTNRKDLAQKMGRDGRKFVLARFDWKVIVEKYLEYFRELGA